MFWSIYKTIFRGLMSTQTVLMSPLKMVVYMHRNM